MFGDEKFWWQIEDRVLKGDRPVLSDELQQVHPGLCGLLAKCWQDDPSRRPSFSEIGKFLLTYNFSKTSKMVGRSGGLKGFIRNESREKSLRKKRRRGGIWVNNKGVESDEEEGNNKPVAVKMNETIQEEENKKSINENDSESEREKDDEEEGEEDEDDEGEEDEELKVMVERRGRRGTSTNVMRTRGKTIATQAIPVAGSGPDIGGGRGWRGTMTRRGTLDLRSSPVGIPLPTKFCSTCHRKLRLVCDSCDNKDSYGKESYSPPSPTSPTSPLLSSPRQNWYANRGSPPRGSPRNGEDRGARGRGATTGCALGTSEREELEQLRREIRRLRGLLSTQESDF